MDVENLPFEELMEMIELSPSPQHIAFKRYDYQKDPETKLWTSLEALRESGVYLVDPRVGGEEWLREMRRGNLPKLSTMLLEGENINYQNPYTKSSAVTIASGSG